MRPLKPQTWFRSKNNRRLKIKVQDLENILIGDQTLQLVAHEQWKESGQLKAIAHSLIRLEHFQKKASRSFSIDEIIASFWNEVNQNGWEAFTTLPDSNLVEVRIQDLFFALNRLRSLQ